MLLSAGGVGWGFYRSLNYDKVAGRAAEAPRVWPEAVPLPRDVDKATLVMLVHPECPCSRASMEELALLVTHCQGKLKAFVLFVKPSGMDKPPQEGSLWQQAELTGVTRVVDDQNMAGKLFQAATSGQVLLYDRGGKLVFTGGITASRGHAGDNDGRAAIESFVLTGKVPATSTPVYGCALQ